MQISHFREESVSFEAIDSAQIIFTISAKPAALYGVGHDNHFDKEGKGRKND
jgi:hypothetical protein